MSRVRKMLPQGSGGFIGANGIVCKQSVRNVVIPIRYLVELAVETAMRRGELLNAPWTDVSFETRTIRIPITKNGHARTTSQGPHGHS